MTKKKRGRPLPERPLRIARKVIVQLEVGQQGDPEYLILWRSGFRELVLTPEDVVTRVRIQDSRLCDKLNAIVVTSIEWRNVPDGFTPPDGA